MQRAIPAMVMRGGTSKGLFFDPADLPSGRIERDRMLLAIMGSPDERQIDGMGGAHPLTSKVALVSRSDNENVDVDYRFLQVHVDKSVVSDGQNCGNILAGVAPYAIERGLVKVVKGATRVRIRMLNSDGIAVATVQTPNGRVCYDGIAEIDGVPGKAAPVILDFFDVAGSSCGALLPTGNAVDTIAGVRSTCVDNGMPVVLISASDLNITGYESPDELEADGALRAKLEAIRVEAGHLMNLDDVAEKTVPKMIIVAAPTQGGAISTRTFIPHRVHQAIGVLGAASVAAACRIPGSVAHTLAKNLAEYSLDIEHPSGRFSVSVEIAEKNGDFSVTRSALLRTARKLMDGSVFVTEAATPC